MGKDRPGLGALGLAVTRPQSRSVTTHTYRDGRQSQPTKMAFTILSTTRSEDERKLIVFKGKSPHFWPHLPPEIVR